MTGDANHQQSKKNSTRNRFRQRKSPENLQLKIDRVLVMSQSEKDLVERLLNALEQTSELLLEFECGWGEKLKSIRRQILVGDSNAVIQLRNCFGTVGSLNDLCITKDNGYKIQKSREKEVNELIQQLVGDLASLSNRVTKPMIVRVTKA